MTTKDGGGWVVMEATFTAEELTILEQTASLYNAFCALPHQHPSDHPEFVAALHVVQLLVLKRPGVRMLERMEAPKNPAG